MFHHLTKGWGGRKGIQEMKLSPHTLRTHENVLTGPGFYAQLSASLDPTPKLLPTAFFSRLGDLFQRG